MPWYCLRFGLPQRMMSLKDVSFILGSLALQRKSNHLFFQGNHWSKALEVTLTVTFSRVHKSFVILDHSLHGRWLFGGNIINSALALGVSYIIFWETYCNVTLAAAIRRAVSPWKIQPVDSAEECLPGPGCGADGRCRDKATRWLFHKILASILFLWFDYCLI